MSGWIVSAVYCIIFCLFDCLKYLCDVLLFACLLGLSVKPVVEVTNHYVGAPAGRNVKIHCKVEASPKATFQWINNRGNGNSAWNSKRIVLIDFTRAKKLITFYSIFPTFLNLFFFFILFSIFCPFFFVFLFIYFIFLFLLYFSTVFWFLRNFLMQIILFTDLIVFLLLFFLKWKLYLIY